MNKSAIIKGSFLVTNVATIFLTIMTALTADMNIKNQFTGVFLCTTFIMYFTYQVYQLHLLQQKKNTNYAYPYNVFNIIVLQHGIRLLLMTAAIVCAFIYGSIITGYLKMDPLIIVLFMVIAGVWESARLRNINFHIVMDQKSVHEDLLRDKKTMKQTLHDVAYQFLFCIIYFILAITTIGLALPWFVNYHTQRTFKHHKDARI